MNYFNMYFEEGIIPFCNGSAEWNYALLTCQPLIKYSKSYSATKSSLYEFIYYVCIHKVFMAPYQGGSILIPESSKPSAELIFMVSSAFTSSKCSCWHRLSIDLIHHFKTCLICHLLDKSIHSLFWGA